MEKKFGNSKKRWISFLGGIIFIVSCIVLTAVGYSSFVYGSGFESTSLNIEASGVSVEIKTQTVDINITDASCNTDGFAFSEHGIENNGVYGTTGYLTIYFKVSMSSSVYTSIGSPSRMSATITETSTSLFSYLLTTEDAIQGGSNKNGFGSITTVDKGKSFPVELVCRGTLSYCEITMNFDFGTSWSDVYSSLTSSISFGLEVVTL